MSKLTLTTLNSSKSAYASFAFDSSAFFETYSFKDTRRSDPSQEGGNRFTCQVYNKALLSVFRGRLGDTKEKDTAVERCEVSIQDEIDNKECRINIKMICRHGVTKTYKLTYESVEIKHALFNPNEARNRWRIGANVLRSFLDYFGANTEQLDIYAEDGRASFTSYTEKVIHGKEILKHPLETSIALDTLDFEEFSVEEKVHVAISVKDFRAIVLHAETLKTNVQAFYSSPNRPMHLTYQEHAMLCEFTLMTVGDYRGSSMTPAPISVRGSSTAPTELRPSRQPSAQPTRGDNIRASDEQAKAAMPPPSQPASRSFAKGLQIKEGPGSFHPESLSQRPSRPSPPPPRASLDPESLFLPAGDGDRQWDETNFDEEEDTLGWDASGNQKALQNLQTAAGGLSRHESVAAWPEDSDRRIAPTQRLSEIETLFSQ
ncbi:MAG: hypothetical protein L6R40_000717 [Gallowayella cf. fulva]|nr:MAG: hypothetical protein L6R40_000717 [Xanthomendoza cf. fulva]